MKCNLDEIAICSPVKGDNHSIIYSWKTSNEEGKVMIYLRPSEKECPEIRERVARAVERTFNYKTGDAGCKL